jgi:hypothetical protein
VKFFSKSKDGGPESNVTGYWLVEIKNWFSIALLKFEPGSREAYHSHAFNCLSWVLSGCLEEKHLTGGLELHRPSLIPFTTKRSTFHQVFSIGRSWVLTFRGPWAKTWREYIPHNQTVQILENGRKVVSQVKVVN